MDDRDTRSSVETVSRKTPDCPRADARAAEVGGRGTRSSVETVSRKTPD